MVDVLRLLLIASSAVYLGLMAGVFWIYGNAIMPGLGRTDDATFVLAFQSIDRKIINPVFLQVYFGALVATGLAAILAWGTPASIWVLTALILYLVTFVITGVVNVPANDRIKAAGAPGPEAAAIRAEFNEARWARWNRVRVWVTIAAFILAIWSLVEL